MDKLQEVSRRGKEMAPRLPEGVRVEHNVVTPTNQEEQVRREREREKGSGHEVLPLRVK